jgi:CDP-glycerol glycerophosphotransferase
MKIDKRNPLHWCYLAASGLWVALAILLRPLVPARSGRKRVLLYGHKLGGNLLALYRYLGQNHADDIEVAFLALDPEYARQLSEQGEAVVHATSAHCLSWLATAEALVSDHGLHAMAPLVRFSSMKFVDVWHSIPFKGFDGDDFRVQHRYDEIWVASGSQRELWIDKYGFRPGIVHATGYARTDCLVRKDRDVGEILRGIGVDPVDCGKVILFAPTWQQDSSNRSLFPFGLEAEEFLGALSGLAGDLGATVLLRTHLNSGSSRQGGRFARVVHVPYASYPDTEAILLASDALVCDWSSIAFDYLLLDRPAFFLDVEMPFRKGFSLGPEYRYGMIVSGLDELIEGLRATMRDPGGYWQAHAGRHAEVKRSVYGEYADGRASARCSDRLLALVDQDRQR